MADDQSNDGSIELATELTIAWLSNPNTRAQANEIPEFLRTMHQAVTDLASPAAAGDESVTESSHQPAVTVRKSIASPEHIVSLIDGKAYKSLKRHLSRHGLTPAEYRQRYGLKADYPMVAPAYAEKRRALAKSIGLGRKPKAATGGQPPKATRARRQKASS
ncbi:MULTISPECIES: MucR family transcriptional regulator [Sphingomonas]|uniref:MucR family transcriptional regulator n=1 Tax=Sphingomonas TaxID=13687 RepID=UPI000DEF0B22|nr:MULTISPECIES: MucR family transcriptional regulator [Sphingomonas]